MQKVYYQTLLCTDAERCEPDQESTRAKKDSKKFLSSDRKQTKTKFLFTLDFAPKSPGVFWHLLITSVKWQSPQLLLSWLRKFNVNRRERKRPALIFLFINLLSCILPDSLKI